MNRRTRLTMLYIAAIGWLAGFWPAAEAIAQTAPTPNLTKGQAVWIGYLFMFVLLVMVLAVSLMPSKRSHQD